MTILFLNWCFEYFIQVLVIIAYTWFTVVKFVIEINIYCKYRICLRTSNYWKPVIQYNQEHNRNDKSRRQKRYKKLSQYMLLLLLDLFGFCFLFSDFFLDSLFHSLPSRCRVFASCFNPCKTFVFIKRIVAGICVATFSTWSIFIT